MSENIEDKQNFLRTEILDQGYDGDQFFEFMTQQKGEDNVNIENWSLGELQDVVYKFKQLMQNENNNNNDNNDNNNNYNNNNDNNYNNNDNNYNNNDNNDNNNFYQENQNAPENNNQNNNNEIINNNEQSKNQKKEDEIITIENLLSYTNNLKNYDQSIEENDKKEDEKEKEDINSPFNKYNKIINCKTLEETELNNKDNIIIIVSNPILIKKGIFSLQSYYQYTIETSPLNYHAIRKYSDFEWLYNKIIELYPGKLVTSLPPSHMGLKENSPKVLNYLNKFINALSENSFICSLKIFEDFIKLPQNEFDKKKKEKYDKLKTPDIMENYTSETGTINLNISKNRDKKAQLIKDDVNKKNNMFQNFRKNIDNILANLEIMSKSFEEFSSCFSNFSKIYENDEILNKGFKLYKNLFKRWSDGYKDQIKFFTYEIKYYFRFMQKEINELNNKINEFNTTKNQYISQFNKINKNNLSGNKNEMDKLENLKINYAFKLYMLRSENFKLNQRHQIRFVKHLIKNSSEKENFIKDYNHFMELLYFNYNNNNNNNYNNNNENNDNYNENYNENNNY